MSKKILDDDYKFMQIEDAMASLSQRVNLIGVVVETSLQKYTRGTDCFVLIRIVDESQPSKGLCVNIFLETMDKLPQVVSVGDILMLNRITIKIHASEVYGVFNKKYSSFALFEGSCGATFVPYQASSKVRTRGQDKKLITGLRKWAADNHFVTGSDDLLFLKNIREGEHFNLVCKILHLCEIKRDVWMLFVWDGTDTPSVPIINKLELEMDDPLLLQLEPISLARDVLCAFPSVGTVLRVKVDPGRDKLGVKFLRPGKWVKLVNLKCVVQGGLWNAVLMPFTRFCYLPDDNRLVLQRRRKYDERVSSKWGWVPSPSIPHLTETDFPDVPFVTLMHALTYPEVTAKFKCVVRVVAALPWRAEDFCSPHGICWIKLTLEDPTGRIHAFLCADDGIYFFGTHHFVDVVTKKRNKLLGVPDNENDSEVTNKRKSDDDSDVVTKKQKKLLGISEEDTDSEVNDVSRNPPWVQCCLKSYYLDKPDPWNSRAFKIFGTKFVG